MKHSFIYVIRFTLMVIGLLIFEACTHVMKVAELPILKTDTPLKGIRPKTFAFKVFKGTDNIPKWRDHSFKFDQPINAVVAKAIKNELQRNGHTCVMDATGSMADFIVDGDVFRFSLAYEMGWWVFRATGEVAVKLTISAVSPGAGTLTKNYEGEYRVHGMFVPIGAFEEILIQALVSLITQMSTDSELIAFHKNDFIETT